ncbi:hypothetical protein [Shewanella violacea]|uniref:Uncharacterized protein n=1 Tax=Shewanella violacea (strain JCM 10179 / CIP 106290 / LMG 19151 / DSS12) TaxID=637905 RepID=D4ZBF3_SHEVD|nr:hypothetical protein [Shewanella violacea]BAJ03348.1 hypothetical protein SVI_3377 [Shewanella violacea DSS12]
MKISILLIIAASLYSSFSWSEAYEDHSNPNLQLCKDFKAYLERNKDIPLKCGLVIDKKFKNFDLPKLQPAPDGLGLRINVQARMVMSDSYQNHLDEAIRLEKGKRYRITRLDFNNDGNTESVLVEDYPDKCLQAPRYYAAYSSYVYDEKHLNIDSSFISSHKSYANQSGEPFFYDGRVYSAMITKTNAYIYEPRGFRENKLISTKSICSYKKMEN